MNVNLRQAIIEKLRAGQRPSDVARDMNVARCTIYSAKKIFDATGGYTKRVAGGRPRTKRTRALVASIKGRIQRKRERSMRQMAREANVSEKTVRRVVNEDLGLISRVKQPKQLVTTQQQEKRLERARRLENRLKGADSGKVLVFSDEKLFSVDRRAHRRNTRFLGPVNPADASKLPPGDRFVFRTQHPVAVMIKGHAWDKGQQCCIYRLAEDEGHPLAEGELSRRPGRRRHFCSQRSPSGLLDCGRRHCQT